MQSDMGQYFNQTKYRADVQAILDALIDEVLDALEAHNGVYIHTSNCVSCKGDNKEVGKFLLLAVEWSVKGKLYPTIGIFICPDCATIKELDQRQMLKNLRYMVMEMNIKVLEE